jgi:hypothetical protein
MATNYPSGTDNLTNPAGTQTLDTPSHSTQHTNANDAIEAMQSTSGTTTGTNVLKHFAAGEFPVRATGVAATGTLQQTLVGGTLNNQVVGTPAITGGTANNIYLGTPTMNSSAITTSYMKPSVIDFEVGTSSLVSVNSASFIPVANGTTTYAVGTANEKLFLWLNAMFKNVSATGNSQITIQVNGTDLDPALYIDAIGQNIWMRQNQPYIVNLSASTTGTFIIVNKTSGTMQVHTSVTTWQPTLKGFAISNV